MFHLGTDAGFFSEYNNMVLAMAWCLENEVEFSLYSADAWFGESGWGRFFKPFCQETTYSIHHRINTRMGGPVTAWNKLLSRAYKMLHPNNQLTFETWQNIRQRDWESHEYNLPQFNFQGNLQQICRRLTDMIWVYNQETKEAIQNVQNQIPLDGPYLGLHIRGGDKYQEDQLYPVSDYLSKIGEQTPVRKAFVLIDDYEAFQMAQKDFPDWELHSLVEEDETGYYHQEFMRKPKDYIYHKMVRLFASVDILKDSELFMGTFSSNPGMFMGMRMEAEKCLSVDGTKWRIW